MVAEFFSDKINSSFEELPVSVVTTFKRQALEVYARAIEYIQDGYDFDKTPFAKFACINISASDSLNVHKVIECGKVLQLNIDIDSLFDEVTVFNIQFPVLKNSQKEDDITLWNRVFKEHGYRLKNLYKIVSFILSLPSSNAYCERVFSVIVNMWGPERNRLLVETVKAEVLTFFNYDYTCEEFSQFLKKPEQKKLLESVKNNQKYIIRKI
jgi:hAT family C-terminal dimerisation region